MKGFVERFRTLREHGEDGMALAGVVMLSAFCFIVVSSLAMTSMVSTQLTANNRSSVLTVSSAESGIDAAMVTTAKGDCIPEKTSAEFGYSYKVYRTAEVAKPTGLSDPNVTAGCPVDGDQYVIIQSTGTDARGKDITIVSTYQWITKPTETVDGALVSGSGSMNVSQLTITGEGADLLLVYGDFNCNSVTAVSGDVLVLGGNVLLTNGCHVYGSVYTSGNIQITSAVGVDGDIYTLGNFSITNPTMIGGSVYTKGTASLSAGTTIKGSLISEGSGNASIGNATINGDLQTLGQLRIENAKIGGNVSSASKAIATIFPTATIGGGVRLGGGIDTWGSGPIPGGALELNQPVPAPHFDVPKQLLPGLFTWKDYPYIQNDWLAAGYNVLIKTSCNYQGNASMIAEINNLTTPTLVDTTACSNVNMYGTTFSLKTDVTFLVNQVNSAQNVTIKSADGNAHTFNIYVPDKVGNSVATCSSGQSTINIYGFNTAPKITSFIYSPCTVSFGGPSTVNGQIYAGIANASGGGPIVLNFRQTTMPGFPSDTQPGNITYDTSATTRAVPLLVARTEG